MPTVLLTGGLGFIGSHTAVELLDENYDVVVVDNLSNSRRDVKDRVEKITGKTLKFYESDVADKESLRKVFCENKIGAVVHFAGYKAVGESVAKPAMYYRNNLDTTLTLLEVMKEFSVYNLVFSSSATVYGSDNEAPFDETMPAGGCTNPYGNTKFFIENILQDVAKADAKCSFVLLRYFNPIGAHKSGMIGELPNGIPNNLLPYISQTASGIREKLSVFGNDYPTPDGTGVRDYIHVVDLAKGHVCALKYAFENTGAEIINLGTGNGYSVLEVIAAYEKASGKKVPYVIADRRAGDIAVSYANAQKAEKLLGWKATKNIYDMCSDSWRWQQYCDKNLK